jgi:DNA adenine methylase
LRVTSYGQGPPDLSRDLADADARPLDQPHLVEVIRSHPWISKTAGQGPPTISWLVSQGSRDPTELPKGIPSGWSPISPLRYPGAKRRLTPIIQALVQANGPGPRLFIEPFCGGAGTALKLIVSGVVSAVLLADLDPLVSSFWQAAAFDTDWLISAMWDEPVTVDRWDYWRSMEPSRLRNPEPRRRAYALKCLFLNRTSYSGILHGRAGPLGGRKQASAYPIGCRFNKGTIQKRLEWVAALAASGRILDVWACDWRRTLERVRLDRQFSALEREEVLTYLDPPYVRKADRLYPYTWTPNSKEHPDMAKYMMASSAKQSWIVSYDDHPFVKEWYPNSNDYIRAQASVIHTASRSRTESRSKSTEILITNLPLTDAVEGLTPW